MLGLNVIAAETDEDAKLQFTSIQQAFANLRLGRPGKMPPPRAGLQLDPLVEHGIAQALSCSVVGGPEKVKRGIADFIGLRRSTAEKGMNPLQAWTGDDVFAGHSPVPVQQPAPEFALLRGLRREADVAPFAGNDTVVVVLPHQPGDTEPGAGTEDEARGMFDRLASEQRDDAFGFEQWQAMGGGGKIIGQRDTRDGKAPAQFGCR